LFLTNVSKQIEDTEMKIEILKKVTLKEARKLLEEEYKYEVKATLAVALFEAKAFGVFNINGVQYQIIDAH